MNVKDLLFEALERDPGERSSWLRQQADEDTCRRVEELLVAHDAADDRLDAIPEVAELVRRVDAYVPPQVGEKIGHFELVRRIGEGGFGVVYHARQERPVKRDVALKVVKAGMDSAALLARFEAEGRALALMDHPSIARVFEFGSTEGGAPYFAMELVDGEPITQYAKRRELGLHARLALFVDVCMAIQHAHQKGVVHRDVKPANVLVTEVDGEPLPKVIDFGIAKALMTEDDGQSAMTRQGHLLGTPAFMSPEQLGGSADIDTRTDVYALGVLLYELLTGETPFDVRGMEITRIIELVQTQEPQRPSRAGRAPAISVIPSDLDWVCLRALEKERVRRYESASDLARDIGRYLERLPVDAAPPSTWYRLRKLAVRHRALAVTGAVVMTALVVAVAGLWVGLDTARRANDETSAALIREEAEARRAREVLSFFTHELLEAAVPSGEPGRGRDVRVVDVLDIAARRLEAGNGPGDALVELELRRSLGSSFLALGQLESAREHIEQALVGLRELRGPAHFDVLNLERGLVQALRGLGETNTAETLLDHHDEMLRNAEDAGGRAVERLRSEVLRGLLHIDHGRFDEASVSLDSVVERAADLDPGLRLEALDKLALAAVMVGDFDRAVDAYGQVYAGRVSWIGENDPLTLTSKVNAGNALRSVGKYDEAALLINEGIAGLKDVLGARHPDALVAQLAQVWLAVDTGNIERAHALAEPLWDATQEVFGERHRDTIEILAVRTVIALQRGEPEAAERTARLAYETSKAVLGEDHPSTWIRANELAAAYFALERYDDVAPILEANLRGQETALGSDHPSTLNTLSNIAVLHLQLGNVDEADVFLDDVLDRNAAREEPIPKVHFGATSNKVAVLSLQGRPAEAVATATAVLAELESHWEAFPMIKIELFARRGEAHAALEQFAESIDDMTRAYGVIVDVEGADSYAATDAASLVQSWCEELGRMDDAESWAARAR